MATAKSSTLSAGFSGGGTTKTVSITKTASARVSIEEDVATAETDFEITTPLIDISAATLIYILSTQNVTFETNANNAAGGNTLTLVANEPYMWWTGAPFVNMLTEDIVTNVFVTNASGATAVVTIDVLQDATPA
ncbi:MAG TPA: hypothetical protein VMX74_06990 [Pirellulales bacterium]|nr:hypothetical protein [Pirellulales bacterium]